MDRPHLRPRFILLVPGTMDEVRATMEARLKSEESRFVYRVRRLGVLVWIKPPARRFWSPSLDTLFREHPRGTLVVGRFGPQGSLMTGYFFVTIMLAFLTCLSATWAMVQWTMGESPHCLLGSACGVVGIAAVWTSARIGTWLAREQMGWLAEVVDGLGEVQTDEAAILADIYQPGMSGAAPQLQVKL